jgi:hypothetical protein
MAPRRIRVVKGVEHHLRVGDRGSRHEVGMAALQARNAPPAAMSRPLPLVSELRQADGDLVEARQHALGDCCSLGGRSDGAGMQMQRMKRLLRQGGHIGRGRYRLRAGPRLLMRFAGTPPSSILLAHTPATSFGRFVSQPAVRAAASYAASHPQATILADDVTGSDLLWSYPALTGRVGYDARTEVYRPNDFLRFARFLTVTGRSWTAASRGYDVVAVTCSLHRSSTTLPVRTFVAR